MSVLPVASAATPDAGEEPWPHPRRRKACWMGSTYCGGEVWPTDGVKEGSGPSPTSIVAEHTVWR
jgi:hypothetical protein